MPTSKQTPRMLRGDEAQLFAAHHATLQRAVRRAVRGPDAVVEDACSYAWLQLLRSQPQRTNIGAWLRTVAVRHAWDLNARERRDEHYDAMDTPHDLLAAPALGDAAAARDALGALSALPEPQRRCLALVIAGHSYTEVAAITGRTRTNVNKQLTRARRNLHHA